MTDVLKIIDENKHIKVAIVIVIAIIIYVIAGKILKKGVNKFVHSKKIENKTKTYIKVISNLLRYTFILCILLFILQLNGINITAILTGVGVVGVIGGVALQDTLKDLIMGVNIILEDFFNVGDIVRIGDVEGKVISFGLKTTKIQDIDTNSIYTIANRSIDKIYKVSDWIDINLPTSYNNKIEEVEGAMEEIVEEVKKLEHVTDCEYKGINEFGASSIDYRLRIHGSPEFKRQTRRNALRIAKIAFDKNNISIPYMQVDVHNV